MRILVPQGTEKVRSPVMAEQARYQLLGNEAAETQLAQSDISRPKCVSSKNNSRLVKRSQVPSYSQMVPSTRGY